MTETLKALRKQAGLSAKDVAEKLGVSRSAISNYEDGLRRISLEMVLALASIYGVSEKEVIQAQINSCLDGTK